MNTNNTTPIFNTLELQEYYKRIYSTLSEDSSMMYRSKETPESIITPAEAQFMVVYTAKILQELEVIKKEHKVFAQEQWEVCNVDDASTLRDYDVLKRILTMKERTKVMANKFAVIQKKLKFIAAM